ncbi:MAG: lipopolysaccharide biosynthesis protein [Solirubrobacteraceae bacterium]
MSITPDRDSTRSGDEHELEAPTAATDSTREQGEDVLSAPSAGGRVIRGSVWRLAGNVGGMVVGIGTAALLLRHLGVEESGRYVTVMSLVAIASSIGDAGMNATGSRELALREPAERRELVANFVGLRLLIAPAAIALVTGFAFAAGYPSRMVVGTVLAACGLFIGALADAALLRLGVELRNGPLAFVDFLKQAVTLVGVALLVLLGAHLTPFFAVQVAVGLVVAAVVPLLAGRGSFPLPRFDRAEQRALLTKSLPTAAAIIVGQVYFRLVIVLMSLISSPRQVGYFGGSLRAMEALITVPMLVSSVALPLLAAAARDDRSRLRYALAGLSEAAIIGGVLVVLVTVRAAEPVMSIVGSQSFRGAGAVLRIQVGALLFIALYQIWTFGLIALGRQRQLVFTNAAALLGVAVFAVVLVPALGAQGGAIASVLGDALLACLIYWRLQGAAGRVFVRLGFLCRVALAAAPACGAMLIPGLPSFAAAALTGALFLGVGLPIGMFPPELWQALDPRRRLARWDAAGTDA